MSDYTKTTNFTSKDSLSVGNPLKIVRGSEIDTEFNNIATAVATKLNTADFNSTLAAKFPNITGAVNGTQGDLNALTDGPVFRARRTTDQVVPSGVATKVQLTTEDFDLTSAFDSTTNYRFQPTTAGYYQINGSVYAKGNITLLIVSLYKNGAIYSDAFHTVPATGDHKLSVSDVVYLNGSTDYVELYGLTTGTTTSFGAGSAFSGSLIRAA